jgi:hypothetical protein
VNFRPFFYYPVLSGYPVARPESAAERANAPYHRPVLRVADLPDAAPMISTVPSCYRIVEKLGGGTGKVCSAENTTLGRRVSVKRAVTVNSRFEPWVLQIG